MADNKDCNYTNTCEQNNTLSSPSWFGTNNGVSTIVNADVGCDFGVTEYTYGGNGCDLTYNGK